MLITRIFCLKIKIQNTTPPIVTYFSQILSTSQPTYKTIVFPKRKEKKKRLRIQCFLEKHNRERTNTIKNNIVIDRDINFLSGILSDNTIQII